jgi:hypothetical protein
MWSFGRSDRPVQHGDAIRTGCRLGVKLKSSRRAYVFRFTLESGLNSDFTPWPFGANSGSREIIQSLARASSAGGMVRPRAFADFRLTVSWALVDCCTGKLAGFFAFENCLRRHRADGKFPFRHFCSSSGPTRVARWAWRADFSCLVDFIAPDGGPDI